MRRFVFGIIVVILMASIPARFALASTTDGTIDAASKYAWGENVGWLNLGTTEGNIHVTDSGLTGYVWGENVGWISLSCSNAGSCSTVEYSVANTSSGTLSGYAWGENVGWIHFAPSGGGVTIDASGVFGGYAWGENVGWIVFNCTTTNSCGTVAYNTATDWRPASARVTPSAAAGGSTTASVFSTPATVSVPVAAPSTDTPPPAAPEPPAVVPTSEPSPSVVAPSPPPSAPSAAPSIVERITEVVPFLPVFPVSPHILAKLPAVLGALPRVIALVLPDFLPSRTPAAPFAAPRMEAIPRVPPRSLARTWDMISVEALRVFLFAPLPREFVALTRKFPSLGESLTGAGIATFADVRRVPVAALTIPGLTAAVGLPTTTVPQGPLDIPHGVPLAVMPIAQRKAIPADIVFPRGGGELVDLPIGISVTDEGKPKQVVTAVAGQTVQLVVRPQERVSRVRGYVVFRRNRAPAALRPIPLQSLAASFLFATPVFAHPQAEPVDVVEEFVLVAFEYADPDGDGVYAAEIALPVVAGEYEVITVMEYEDPARGAKEIRLTTIIDPEGYVFERIRGREVRIRGAQVTMERWNAARDAFEQWPADLYRQENPQTTSGSGAYSFLVPEGQYRLRVTADGYRPYAGAPFIVRGGDGIHSTIALTRARWAPAVPDVKTVILIALILFVLYNFSRDIRRERQRVAPPSPPPPTI